MGSCIILRNSILIASSLARIRFLVVLRPMTKVPVCTENLIRVDDVMESPKLWE